MIDRWQRVLIKMKFSIASMKKLQLSSNSSPDGSRVKKIVRGYFKLVAGYKKEASQGFHVAVVVII